MTLLRCTLAMLLLFSAAATHAEELFRMPPAVTSHWTSFENPSGAKGAGGKANAGAKGAAFAPVAPGEEKVLLDVEGSGTVRRIWMTMNARVPEALRSFVIRMYWDGEDKPAVEAPVGDFFGHILGRSKAFESEFFSSPEGRSFNCVIPMPFRKGAKITFTNESELNLPQLFYDINYTLGDAHPDDALYFHAFWQRVPRTELGVDFEILPRVEGAGRYLGTHMGIIGGPDNIGWWGEGEVKIYLDGDTDYPTLCGSGTEDYVGTAYGQGEYHNRYQGSLLIDNANRRWTFYRLHVPDPVYFRSDARVTIQQMGGSTRKSIIDLLNKGVEIKPVSIQNDDDGFIPLIEGEKDLADPALPDGWTNMYRRDDVSAVAFFYLDQPASQLPRIQPLAERIANL
ncbi:MAG: hypothetical protein RLZZ303_3470 [Candidatus Hydrogenedentota bacterium]